MSYFDREIVSCIVRIFLTLLFAGGEVAGSIALFSSDLSLIISVPIWAAGSTIMFLLWVISVVFADDAIMETRE